VKKRQQRVVMILESKGISYEAVDITEPGKEEDKEYMQKNSKIRDEGDRHPLPPQIFNDAEYCGVSYSITIFVQYLESHTHCCYHIMHLIVIHLVLDIK
jgi:glutaredoxin